MRNRFSHIAAGVLFVAGLLVRGVPGTPGFAGSNCTRYRIDVVDQAAIKEKKRFNRKIFVSPPTASGRREILAIYAGRIPLAGDVDLSLVARKAEGCTGWDIGNLCRKAAILAVEEGARQVALRHFLSALERITPWLTPDMVEGYRRIFREDCPHHYSF